MRRIILIFVLCALFLVPAVAVHAQGRTRGIEVTCSDGRTITNGAEFIVNMRSGFTYTATVLGVNGFDPVVGVGLTDDVRSGRAALCEDDTRAAAGYTANLPTTGAVPASGLNSQLPFSNNSNSAFEDISIVVGGFAGASGEFLLILEGMSVTTRDGDGDPFAIHFTENMLESGVDPTVYMMTIDGQVDPLVRLVNNQEVVLECNDAGTASCDGESSNLGSSAVSRTQGRQTRPDATNAMLTIPASQATDWDFSREYYFNFLMTSPDQSSGEYVVVFHAGVSSTPGGTPLVTTQPTPTPGAQIAPPTTGRIPGGGIDVTCADGRQITNGVEIIVNMRPGFTYIATAIGVNGFDPVMGVGLTENIRAGRAELCEDDTPAAGSFEANLPTTGPVASSSLNAQVPFSHNQSSFADISIVIGGFGGVGGQFIVVLEGMAVTAADGDGDPFTIRLTPNMVNAEVDLAAYMLAAGSLDALMRFVVGDSEVLAECDDAGTRCQEGTSSLSGSFVSRTQGRTTPSSNTNAMLIIPTTTFIDLDFDNQEYLMTFLMTSFGQSFGDYVVAFHFGIAEPVASTDL